MATTGLASAGLRPRQRGAREPSFRRGPTLADSRGWAPQMSHSERVTDTDDVEEHVVTIVPLNPSRPGSARWKCTCGASTGGKWLRSEQEAQKAADRHIARSRGPQL